MQEVTSDYTEQYKQDAQRRFDNELNPLLTKLFALGTSSLKAKLTKEGLKKVLTIDKKREANHDFDQEMSDQTWEFLEEICDATVNLLLIKLSNSYGLKIGRDWERPSASNPETPKKTNHKK